MLSPGGGSGTGGLSLDGEMYKVLAEVKTVSQILVQCCGCQGNDGADGPAAWEPNTIDILKAVGVQKKKQTYCIYWVLWDYVLSLENPVC